MTVIAPLAVLPFVCVGVKPSATNFDMIVWGRRKGGSAPQLSVKRETDASGAAQSGGAGTICTVRHCGWTGAPSKRRL